MKNSKVNCPFSKKRTKLKKRTRKLWEMISAQNLWKIELNLKRKWPYWLKRMSTWKSRLKKMINSLLTLKSAKSKNLKRSRKNVLMKSNVFLKKLKLKLKTLKASMKNLKNLQRRKKHQCKNQWTNLRKNWPFPTKRL